MEDGSSAPRSEKDKDLTAYAHDDNSSLSSGDLQPGVKGIEAISQTWTTWSLVVAYLGVLLVAFCTSLEVQTTVNLTAFATSAFSHHSLISTVYVVQSVVNAVIKPPMAKVANVFGRLEAFCFSVFLYVIGYIQMAGSQNVQTFASAQIFYSAGSTGLQILIQIFVADTTDLMWRALFSTLPDVPFLITTWVGSPLAQSLLNRTTWRWGYGLWAIVLPVAFLPLAMALFMNKRKAAKQGLAPVSPWKGLGVGSILKKLWFELDVMGLLLLSAAISLILLPLTLAATAGSGWRNASIIAMIVLGVVFLFVFPVWEITPKLSPSPFLSLRLLTNRNVLAGCAIGFFYFAVFYMSVFPYFYSYLLVVQGESITAAGHVTQTFSFTSTVAGLVVSLLIMKTKHYKYFITAGSAIYLMGIGLMIRYRVEGSSIGSLVGTQIAVGIGGGMLNVPTQLGVQASVSHGDVAAATAIYLCCVEIGGAVGSAISGAIWTANLPAKLTQYLPANNATEAADIFANVVLAESFAAGSPERIAVNRAYQETMNLLLIGAVCLAVPPLLLSLLLKNYKLDQVDQRVKGVVIGKSQQQDESLSHGPVNTTEVKSSTGEARTTNSFLGRFRR